MFKKRHLVAGGGSVTDSPPTSGGSGGRGDRTLSLLGSHYISITGICANANVSAASSRQASSYTLYVGPPSPILPAAEVPSVLLFTDVRASDAFVVAPIPGPSIPLLTHTLK